MKPTKLEALALVREHFNLTLSELCTLMNEPTQPKGLRDDVAIAAMSALIMRSNMVDIKWISDHAYLFADGMLTARTKE